MTTAAVYTHTIPARALAACLVAAPKSDIRNYLVGVLVSPALRAVAATDGHMLVRCNVPEITGGPEVILPRASVEAALATVSKRALGEMSAILRVTVPPGEDEAAPPSTLCEMSINGASFACAPVEGRYPDICRVVPPFDAIAAPAVYDPALTGRADKALQLWQRSNVPYAIVPYGEKAGVAMSSERNALALVMPMRSNLISEVSEAARAEWNAALNTFRGE